MSTKQSRNLMIVLPQQDILFSLGRVVATRGAEAAMAKNQCSIGELLTRHLSGDWGNVVEEAGATNQDAVKNGKQIHSVYRVTEDCTLWVITESNRSLTTVLLPNEY